MEAHGCNPSPWKAEARESPQIQGQPEPQCESQDNLGYIMWDFISEQQEKMRVKLLIAQNVSFPFLFDVYVCLVCTHTPLHVFMCVCVWVLEYMCMCVRILLMSYVFPHCFPLYLLRVSPWIWSLAISCYPTRDAFSASWVLVLQGVPCLPGFYVGSGDLNARLHVWILKYLIH